MAKLNEKQRAIQLRKKGLSYKEILDAVKVAKSTLSLWLRDVGLTKQQMQRITQKKLLAGRRGAQSRRQKKVLLTGEIIKKAKEDIGHISKKELWLMGIMLYWAEGSKEKQGWYSTRVKLSNSDPKMLKVFKKWLKEICNIDDNRIKYEMYIHENHKGRLSAIKNYWAKALDVSPTDFKSIYFKKHKLSSRKRQGMNYFGLLSLVVRKSTNLNRQIAGWIEGISQAVAG